MKYGELCRTYINVSKNKCEKLKSLTYIIWKLYFFVLQKQYIAQSRVVFDGNVTLLCKSLIPEKNCISHTLCTIMFILSVY